MLESHHFLQCRRVTAPTFLIVQSSHAERKEDLRPANTGEESWGREAEVGGGYGGTFKILNVFQRFLAIGGR